MENGTKFGAVQTELGWVGVAVGPKGLRAVNLPVRKREEALGAIAEFGGEPVPEDELGSAATAVRDIVSGRPYANGVELDWSGITPFRRQVLEECARIPAGEVRSYGWLAEKVGRPRSARAVGRVMATNPWPLFVPCHRVVGSDGSLHGYGGGLPMKEALLRAEGAR
ncbi:MAG TPA: MGMT family protein [Dehalococcoidia bacterium]|nr:MGMT family protein [Dehalococcoidia bacterium]